MTLAMVLAPAFYKTKNLISRQQQKRLSKKHIAFFFVNGMVTLCAREKEARLLFSSNLKMFSIKTIASNRSNHLIYSPPYSELTSYHETYICTFMHKVYFQVDTLSKICGSLLLYK